MECLEFDGLITQRVHSKIYCQQLCYVTQCCQIRVMLSISDLHIQLWSFYNTMLPDMPYAICFKFALSTMILYNTMLPDMRHAIYIKCKLSTMILYNTMLPDMRHAIYIKCTLSTMILYNTVLPDMLHAISTMVLL